MLFIGRSEKSFWPRVLAGLSYALPLLFIIAPFANFLIYGFYHLENGKIEYGLSLANYVRFFTDPIFIPVLWHTFLLCLGVALLTVTLGYPVAFLLASLKGRSRHFLLLMVLVPLLMSYIIKIYAIRSILGGTGFLNRFLLWTGILSESSKLFVFNLNAVFLTLTVLLVPFAILPIFLALERIPKSLIEASIDLGASGVQTFQRIILPLSAPGVVTAVTFVFVLAIGDFVTPQMVGGQSGFTYGRIIYSQFGTAFNWPFGAALATILGALVIMVILIAGRFERQRT